MRLYTDLAEHYFAIENHHRDMRRDLAFLRSFIPVGRSLSLLDLGCGTGEYLSALCRDGHHGTGVDSSREMLRWAKARDENSIRYIEQDIQDIDFFEEFDIVFSLFGSFDYLIDEASIDKAFWNVWRALKTDGAFLLEVWNSTPILMIRSKELGHVSTTKSGGLTIDRERGFSLQSSTPAIVNVNYRYSIQSMFDTKIIEDTHTMRAFSVNEIKDIASRNGFRIQGCYSNSLKEGFSESSNRIMLSLVR